MSASTLPTLQHYFSTYYRGPAEITYETLVQYLVHLEKTEGHLNLHYRIAPEDAEEFAQLISRIAGALYSPQSNASIYQRYEIQDVSIMIEGSTRPIRIRMAHPDLPDHPVFGRTFYVKKNSDFHPRLIGSVLYHIFSIHPFDLWVNDKIIVASEAKGTVASRLKPGRLDELLSEELFIYEAIRCNVLIRWMLLADMFPKNYIVRRIFDNEMQPRWDIVAIDFDHAFLPETLAEAQLIMPDFSKPLTLENNLLPGAIQRMYSQEAISVLVRQEEERIAGIYLSQYEHLNMLFQILQGHRYSKSTFRSLNQEFVETYGFGKVSPFLGDLLKNSFDYLLKKIS